MCNIFRERDKVQHIHRKRLCTTFSETEIRCNIFIDRDKVQHIERQRVKERESSTN